MIKRKFSCSYMQFNGVSNEEHWRSLVVGGFLGQNSICSLIEVFLHVL